MKVAFYATLRAIVGAKTVELDLPEGTTVQGLAEHLCAKWPDLEEHPLQPARVRSRGRSALLPYELVEIRDPALQPANLGILPLHGLHQLGDLHLGVRDLLPGPDDVLLARLDLLVCLGHQLAETLALSRGRRWTDDSGAAIVCEVGGRKHPEELSRLLPGALLLGGLR